MKIIFFVLLLVVVGCAAPKPTYTMKLQVTKIEAKDSGYWVYMTGARHTKYKTFATQPLPDSVKPGAVVNINLIHRIN